MKQRPEPFIPPNDSGIAHIHGLGPSIKDFKPDGNFIIGVNDSWRYWISDYLIVMNVFRNEPQRTQIVWESHPKKLFSHVPGWARHPNYEYIGSTHPWRPDRPQSLNKGLIYHSNNSPFIGASMAFNLGFREIVLWGVDFTSHPIIKGDLLDRVKEDFETFGQAIGKLGVKLFLGSEGSVLSLPQWKSVK